MVGSMEQPISGVDSLPGTRPAAHHEVLQLDHGPPAGEPHHAARQICVPTFGRPGQCDVLALGIIERVAHAEQSGQVQRIGSVGAPSLSRMLVPTG